MFMLDKRDFIFTDKIQNSKLNSIYQIIEECHLFMRREYIIYPQDMPVTISYANMTEYPIHWHNSIEILYVIKGKFYITIDSDKYELVENDIEIVNIDEAHSITSSDKDNRMLIFHIDPNFYQKYYSDIQNVFLY